MNPAMKTVTAYYDAFGRKDLKRLREVLAPEFTFKGPLMAFDNPDAFVEAMGQMRFQATVDGSRFIADGDRVAHAFLWKMTAPAQADVPMCEVFEVSGGRSARPNCSTTRACSWRSAGRTNEPQRGSR